LLIAGYAAPAGAAGAASRSRAAASSWPLVASVSRAARSGRSMSSSDRRWPASS